MTIESAWNLLPIWLFLLIFSTLKGHFCLKFALKNPLCVIQNSAVAKIRSRAQQHKVSTNKPKQIRLWNFGKNNKKIAFSTLEEVITLWLRTRITFAFWISLAASSHTTMTSGHFCGIIYLWSVTRSLKTRQLRVRALTNHRFTYSAKKIFSSSSSIVTTWELVGHFVHLIITGVD